VPFALAAGVALLIAAHTYTTGRPDAVYVVKGPDGRRWEWKGGNVTYSGIEQWLSTNYGKQIRFGSDGVDWPTRYHARDEAQQPALIGLGLLVCGVLWYLFFWTVGWVISGFQREGE
jgi:hypothetical protein